MSLTPPVYQMLVLSLQKAWQRYHECVCSSRTSVGRREIHNLRTSLRRLISVLDVVMEFQSGNLASDFRKKLKLQLDFLRDLRDLQTQENLFDKRIKSSELLAFLAELKNEIKSKRKAIKPFLDSISIKNQALHLETLCEGLLILEKRSHTQQNPKSKLEQLLIQSFKNFEHHAWRVDESKPATFHKARIEFKKFRYTWEALTVEFPMSKSSEKNLKLLQDTLGEIQDSVVLQSLLIQFLVNSHMARPSSEFLSFLRATETKQMDGIARFVSSREIILQGVRPPVQSKEKKAA